MIDTHVHSNISYDGKSSIEEYIKTSSSKKVSEITFTEHLDISDEKINIDLDNYYKTFITEKEKSILPIYFGLEVGMNQLYNNRISEIVKNYPFDFIIGSSHVVNGYVLGEDEELLKRYSNNEIYKMYYQEVLNNINTFNNFDVYGHLDHIIRYIAIDKDDAYKNNKKLIDEVLISLIERGKGIEVNSSGFRFDCNGPHPSIELLKRYKQLGGKIITIGSDAHKYWELSRDLDNTLDVIEECGFKSLSVFHNRKPTKVNVKDLRKEIING